MIRATRELERQKILAAAEYATRQLDAALAAFLAPRLSAGWSSFDLDAIHFVGDREVRVMRTDAGLARQVLAFMSVSADDKACDHIEKIQKFRLKQVPLVWMVFAGLRVGYVMLSNGDLRLVNEDGGVFDGGDVLPGLRIKLADVLPPRPTPEPSPAESAE